MFSHVVLHFVKNKIYREYSFYPLTSTAALSHPPEHAMTAAVLNKTQGNFLISLCLRVSAHTLANNLPKLFAIFRKTGLKILSSKCLAL
jgi:hypothetical protein